VKSESLHYSIKTTNSDGCPILYEVDSNYYLSDSLLHLNIEFSSIHHDLPKIKINNDEIDTGFYPDHFYYKFLPQEKLTLFFWII